MLYIQAGEKMRFRSSPSPHLGGERGGREVSAKIEFGDLVECKTPDLPEVSRMICIGEMAYSTPESRVILLATDTVTGMPVNVAHCLGRRSGSLKHAQELRARYEQKYPNRMKAQAHPKGERE
jgi:hypothetical protein